MMEKHVLIGSKHYLFGRQTFDLLQRINKRSRQSLKVHKVDDL